MLSNIVFKLIYSGLVIFSPVLPNTPKIYEAILVYTVVFIMFIMYDKMKWNDKKKQGIKVPEYRWQWFIAPAVLLVICLLFAFGAFGFTPVAVATNSMKGEFSTGDVVLVRKISKIDISSIEESNSSNYCNSVTNKNYLLDSSIRTSSFLAPSKDDALLAFVMRDYQEEMKANDIDLSRPDDVLAFAKRNKWIMNNYNHSRAFTF